MNRGEDHHSAQLTEAKVRAMRRLADQGWNAGCLSRAYKVSYNTAWDVINYLTWRHVR